jgi:hypothetical protein
MAMMPAEYQSAIATIPQSRAAWAILEELMKSWLD